MTLLAIEAHKLVKEYKNGVRALDELNLSVRSGEIFALLGPNGAGKSSLINTLTTYLIPTSGSVTMLGRDLIREASCIRPHIACVAQKISIDTHLSMMENLVFQSRIYKIDPESAKININKLIKSFNLDQYLKYPVGSYSGGIKRRLDIAMNMVSNPKLLFLDEPTVGLDIESRKVLWDMILKIRNEFGTTVLLTTHYLEEADELSDTVCIIKDGYEVIQGTPHNLRGLFKQNKLRIGFGSMEQAQNCRKAISNTTSLDKSLLNSIKTFNTYVVIQSNDIKSVFKSVNTLLSDEGIDFTSLEILQPTLEDIFLSFTKQDDKGETHEHSYIALA